MAKGIDTAPSQVATNALQAIPFGSIIGAPLSACIDAQAKAAQTTWDYIQKVGLTEDENGERKAIYVNFEYRKNGKAVTLSVPLLTIVPIPFLAVKHIDIAFKASISASASTSTTESESLEVGASAKAKVGFNYGFVKGSMEMSASVSSKKDSTSTRDSKYSVEYTMDVNVRAEQDDMPAGMAKVLEILNESIDSIDAEGELRASEQFIRLKNGSGSTYITYKNNEGYFQPDAIKVYSVDDSGKVSENPVEDTVCSLAVDECGVLAQFFAQGAYVAKPEGNAAKTLKINVVNMAPQTAAPTPES